jgi:hypothetical protein
LPNGGHLPKSKSSAAGGYNERSFSRTLEKRGSLWMLH